MPEFFLKFHIEGTTLQVRLGPVPSERYKEGPCTSYIFQMDTHDPEFALLLKEYYQDLLEQLMKEERKRCYNAGWKDAKAHVTKQSWFPSFLGSWKP